MPIRRQAMIWINDALSYWGIYAFLGLNELSNPLHCELIDRKAIINQVSVKPGWLVGCTKKVKIDESLRFTPSWFVQSTRSFSENYHNI